MSANPPLDEDGELLAAELAFALLDPQAMQEAHARLETDPSFADAYRRWQKQVVALLDAPSEPPPALLWTRIEARLPANDADRRSERATLARWRLATLAACLIAAMLGAVAVGDRRPPSTPPAASRAPAMMALLTGARDEQVAVVTFDPATRRLSVVQRGLNLGEKSPELWIIPEGRKPHSLGIVAVSETAVRQPPAAVATLIAGGATLAISVEPAGGSPTGQPTGPVILTGKIAAI